MKKRISHVFVTGALALALFASALVGGSAFWHSSGTAFSPSYQPSHQSAYKAQPRNGQSAYKAQPRNGQVAYKPQPHD